MKNQIVICSMFDRVTKSGLKQVVRDIDGAKITLDVGKRVPVVVAEDVRNAFEGAKPAIAAQFLELACFNGKPIVTSGPDWLSPSKQELKTFINETLCYGGNPGRDAHIRTIVDHCTHVAKHGLTFDASAIKAELDKHAVLKRVTEQNRRAPGDKGTDNQFSLA